MKNLLFLLLSVLLSFAGIQVAYACQEEVIRKEILPFPQEKEMCNHNMARMIECGWVRENWDLDETKVLVIYALEGFALGWNFHVVMEYKGLVFDYDEQGNFVGRLPTEFFLEEIEARREDQVIVAEVPVVDYPDTPLSTAMDAEEALFSLQFLRLFPRFKLRAYLAKHLLISE